MKIFDLHSDTVWKIFQAEEKGEVIKLKKNNLAIDVEKLKQANVGIQTMAIYDNYYQKDAYGVGIRMINILKRELEENPELSLVKNYADFERNLREGKISVLMSVEDGCIVEGSIDKLRDIYNRGVRMIGLNHNYKNEICSPNYGKYNENGRPDYRTPDNLNGLTPFGFEMVKEMNKLGMVVDVSHSSDKGFYDVIEISDKPIMCSHSNARSVCSHVRNLSDDMLKKLADNGGVTGINFAAAFMDNDVELGNRTLECSLRHIEYIKNLIGVDHIALGSDFDGIQPTIDFKDVTYFKQIPEALDRLGYSDEDIEKICYKNALRVFKENMH